MAPCRQVQQSTTNQCDSWCKRLTLCADPNGRWLVHLLAKPQLGATQLLQVQPPQLLPAGHPPAHRLPEPADPAGRQQPPLLASQRCCGESSSSVNELSRRSKLLNLHAMEQLVRSMVAASAYKNATEHECSRQRSCRPRTCRGLTQYCTSAAKTWEVRPATLMRKGLQSGAVAAPKSRGRLWDSPIRVSHFLIRSFRFRFQIQNCTHVFVNVCLDLTAVLLCFARPHLLIGACA